MKDKPSVVIIGAGPTGLGAAYRLHELGYTNYTVLEAGSEPGGLAGSVVDAKGFTWDMGGHVQFSHYPYYDQVLDKALGDQWLYHLRESWIWIKNRFIPYPFQYNIHLLDEADCTAALEGLRLANASPQGQIPGNFRQWIEQTFGQGLADLFMLPYNFKVWGYDPAALGVGWMGERVAVPDLARIEQSVQTRQMSTSWGPNNKFRFPKRGGTGAIWKGVYNLLPSDCFQMNASVERIDSKAKQVQLSSGEMIPYDSLLSTIPLDQLCRKMNSLTLAEQTSKLMYSAVHIIGIGIEGEPPEHLKTKNWMYFPESNSPYFRVTLFSNYSPHNVPSGSHWSLMAEVSETSEKPVQAERLKEWTLRAMKEDGLLPEHSRVVSVWSRRLPYGYPTPSLGRDPILHSVIPELEKMSIYSRGRFGGWKYEVSNQDHSFMQGVEWVDRMLQGKDELTYFDPDRANAGVKTATVSR